MMLKTRNKPGSPDPGREPVRAFRRHFTARALSFMSLTWAQILLALIVGALLSSMVLPEQKYWGAFHHVGIGLLVAAVVTLFWHIREFSDFFERFARSVLLEDAWLSRLKTETLTDLRSRAGQQILESCVDNDEYMRGELADWIDQILYHRLLPDPAIPSQGMYRENYREYIVIENMSLEEALRDVGEDPARYPRDVLGSPVHKIVTTTTYTLIAPSKSSSEYKIELEARFADMPHFPLPKRMLFRAGHSRPDAKTVNLKVTDRELGGIDVNADPVSLEIEGGKCAVWTQAVEFRSPRNEAHILNSMALLTRGMQVDLFQAGREPYLVFDGGIVAFGAGDPTFDLHTIHLRFDHWLFENQGYCIWWWQRETVAKRAEASTQPEVGKQVDGTDDLVKAGQG
ncbi:MAG TPA: hypothetical protein VHQ90_17080 [Thermoanaerobaculia bacterium]|nr:hypothetical protein [Thermoanaerobaculia bacterium]